MAESRIRNFGKRTAQPIVSLIGNRLNPDVFTIAGAVFSVVAAFVIGAGYFLAGAMVLTIGSLCDWLDGELARAQVSTTAFGAYLDAVVDRVSDCSPLAALAGYFAWHHQPIGTASAMIALVAAAMIPYAKAALRIHGHAAAVGLLPRTPRLILIIASVACGPAIAVWGIMLIAVLGTITVFQRIRQAHKILTGVQIPAA